MNRAVKRYVPGNEEDLTLLAVLIGGEIEVENGITTFISRQRVGKIIVGLIWHPKLINHHLLAFNLKGNKSV